MSNTQAPDQEADPTLILFEKWKSLQQSARLTPEQIDLVEALHHGSIPGSKLTLEDKHSVQLLKWLYDLVSEVLEHRQDFGEVKVALWGEPAPRPCGIDEIVDKILEVKQQRDGLRDAIRKHRDQKGDDRCWMDDELLYQTLPEGYMPPKRDSSVELKLCEQYIKCRHHPGTEYVSPQRRIEELEEEVEKLRNFEPTQAIGQTQKVAEKHFLDHGFTMRVTKVNGQACIVTRDVRRYRFNVETENGKVTKITGRG